MAYQAPAFDGPNPDGPLAGAAQTIHPTSLLIIVWVFFSTSTLFVMLRLTVRFRQNRSLLVDDYWIIWAWLCQLTMAILQTIQIPYIYYLSYLRAGRVAFDFEDTIYNAEQLVRWQFPVIKLFWTVLWSVKGSFMAVFFRFVKPFLVLRRLWYCVVVFAVLAYIGCWLSSALTCSPPSDYFVFGACDSPHELYMQKFNVIFSTSVDISSDLMIMALPISILPSLQLDIRKKIGLGVAFSLGAIIISVAIVRMTQVIGTGDDMVDLVGLAIWGTIESSAAMIVGCLPPLKALLSRNVKKYSSRNKSRYAEYASGGGQGAGASGYGPSSVSRTVMVAESIPLDEMHRSTQKDGGIYVQRTYETTVTFDEASSREGDEVEMVKGRAL